MSHSKDLIKMPADEQFKEIDKRNAEALRRSNEKVADREARRHTSRNTWGNRAIGVGAGVFMALGLNAIAHQLMPDKSTSVKAGNAPAIANYKPGSSPVTVSSGESTPMTVHVKVDKPGGGIYSTVDELAKKGLIEPGHVADYKEDALRLHDGDPNVALGEGIDVPVDQQPKPENP